MTATESGRVQVVYTANVGSPLTADVAAGATVITVDDTSDFDTDGTLQIAGQTVAYSAVDDDTGQVTLTAAVTGTAESGDIVTLWDTGLNQAAVEYRAHVALPGSSIYAASKHAVVGLSLSLRGEAAAYGVRVTAVCPGVVETPILDKGGPDDLPKSPAARHTREFSRHVQSRFYPADRMAQDIVRGLDRNAALVVAPASARLAWRIWRYTPLVANWMTARHVAWARATFGVQPAEAGAGGTAVEASGGSRRPHR